ncbi:MAG: tetratricopeptide repeat protein [Saprospiraceae bacterium]|nr:tetratricopeptide repeat protein [Saprospiraceae bacterium]
MKGLANLALGNTDEARKNFEEALQLAPDFELAKQNLEDLDK